MYGSWHLLPWSCLDIFLFCYLVVIFTSFWCKIVPQIVHLLFIKLEFGILSSSINVLLRHFKISTSHIRSLSQSKMLCSTVCVCWKQKRINILRHGLKTLLSSSSSLAITLRISSFDFSLLLKTMISEFLVQLYE